MRASVVVLVFVSLPLLPACAPGAAQAEGPPRASQRFDPQAVQTVDGRVLGVDRIPIQDQLAYGVRITVRDESGRPVAVHLAPGWYLDKQGLHFSPREQIEVRGYRTDVEGKPAIMAEKITKDGKVVRVRDERGRPLWRSRPAPASSGSAPVPAPGSPPASPR